MKFLALAVSIGSVVLASCVLDFSDGKLMVTNRSNRPIVFMHGDLYAEDSLLKQPPYAIDRTGQPLFTGTEGQDEYTYFILPHATKRMWANGQWESIFGNDTVHRGKTSVYLLDADTVRKYSWSTIRRNSWYLARFHFSRRDLVQQGWRIVYTGKEAAHVHQSIPELVRGKSHYKSGRKSSAKGSEI